MCRRKCLGNRFVATKHYGRFCLFLSKTKFFSFYIILYKKNSKLVLSIGLIPPKNIPNHCPSFFNIKQTYKIAFIIYLWTRFTKNCYSAKWNSRGVNCILSINFSEKMYFILTQKNRSLAPIYTPFQYRKAA